MPEADQMSNFFFLIWRNETEFSDFLNKKRIQSRQLRKILKGIAGCSENQKLILLLTSGGSGYPIPGIPEPDRNYFVIPESDRNLSDQDRNRIGTGLWTGGYPECQKGTFFTQNMATFVKNLLLISQNIL